MFNDAVNDASRNLRVTSELIPVEINVGTASFGKSHSGLDLLVYVPINKDMTLHVPSTVPCSLISSNPEAAEMLSSYELLC